MNAAFYDDYETDPPFWDETPAGRRQFRPGPPTIDLKRLPEHVQAIALLLVITAKDYDACIDQRLTIDHAGLIERILKHQRRPPAASVELFDIREILVKQEDYEIIAARVEGRLRLLERMERRYAA